MSSEIKFPFKGTVFKSGGSIVMIIPSELCSFLDIDIGSEVTIAAMEGRHGRFGGFWKTKE